MYKFCTIGVATEVKQILAEELSRLSRLLKGGRLFGKIPVVGGIVGAKLDKETAAELSTSMFSTPSISEEVLETIRRRIPLKIDGYPKILHGAINAHREMAELTSTNEGINVALNLVPVSDRLDIVMRLAASEADASIFVKGNQEIFEYIKAYNSSLLPSIFGVSTDDIFTEKPKLLNRYIIDKIGSAHDEVDFAQEYTPQANIISPVGRSPALVPAL